MRQRQAEPKSAVEQMTDHNLRFCRHFSGTINKRCQADVCYDQVMDDQAVYPKRLPCSRDGHENCPSREFLTLDEARERAERSAEEIRKSLVAMKAAHEHAAGRRGISDSLPCPICEGGTLSYAVSSYNGHMAAKCSSKGCVAWME